MPTFITWIREHDAALFWLGVASGIMFFASLVIVPILVARLPHDYFAHARRRPGGFALDHPVLRILVVVTQNALGILLLVAGLVMLILPGQGILTLLLGISLMSFPGKYAVQRWLARRAAIRSALNWIRRRAGREPFVFEQTRDG